jgi:Ras family protein A
VLTPLI